MARRRLAVLVRRQLKLFPAVALLGARQVGKTTLARALGGEYFDLEQPEARVRLDVTWPSVVSGNRLVILDEIQNAPELFARLRGAIDADRKRNGRFLLLGSVSPSLIRQSSESLAGRIGLCELTPFTLAELPAGKRTAVWFFGGFPDGGVLRPRQFPTWQRSYLETLAQRDLPQWGLAARPQTTMMLFRMLAAGQGNVWNGSAMGRSLGASHHTINSYLDYCESAYLIRRLPPFHANLRKRLVKSPKVYWRDSGLLHAMLGAATPADLLSKPWVGASWEGFVIEQILNHFAAGGVDHHAYFFRSHDGIEIDLVLEIGSERWAIEVKLTTAPSPGDFAKLDAAADLIGATKRCLISRVREYASDGRRFSCNLWDFLSRGLGSAASARAKRG